MLLSANGCVALEEAEKNFPHPLLSSLMLFVCTEQAGEVVELLASWHPQYRKTSCPFPPESNDFSKKKALSGQFFWKILRSIHWWKRWTLRAVPLVSHNWYDGNSGAQTTTPWEQEFEPHSWRVGRPLMLGASVVLRVTWTSPCGTLVLEHPPWAALWVGSCHRLSEGFLQPSPKQTTAFWNRNASSGCWRQT